MYKRLNPVAICLLDDVLERCRVKSAVSRLEAQAHKSHVTLLASVLDQWAMLFETKDTIKEITKQHVKSVNHLAEKMDNSSKVLKDVASATESINTTVISFRNLGRQLLQT